MRFIKVGGTCPKCNKLVFKDEEWINNNPITSAECPDCKVKVMDSPMGDKPDPEALKFLNHGTDSL